ncbi:MAG: hypothetical protein KC964_10210 [Candidatus Omnitrophica bacterium]|nr:hypothetical protein [Candidatus Omnitrophota bacterium]MCA9441169.1 hypothetical protein [Candidatus Omnitrophota bacterium]MCB9766761.1 hypothetical protein [Candidatus Omnitrophota bacterium]
MTNTPPPNRFKRVALLIGTTLILGILFPLALAEIGLRLFWGGYYEKDAESRYQRDEILGWSPIPNFDGVHGGAEFKVRVRHDSNGMRGREVSPARVHDVSRVVFVGDSMTYGHAASDEEAFVGLLDSRDNGIETVNLGVGGFNTCQEFLRLKYYGFKYHPDLVVLDVFWNDIYWENLESPGPKFEVRDGELVQLGFDLEDLNSELIFQREEEGREWRDRLYVYRLVSDSIKLLRAQFRDNFSRKFKEGSKEKDEKTWAIMEALLLEFKNICEENNTPLLVVLIPDQVEVETDKKVLGLPPQFSEIKPRLEKFLSENDIDFYSPLSDLKEDYLRIQRPLYYNLNRHMTPDGNRALADAMEPVLRETLALE